MSIALDIGTRHLRSLRREGNRLVGRKNRAVYLALPDKPAQRRILEKASIRYATCAGSLLVIGQSAIETADMLESPCIPLLADSRLPAGDPVARQVLTSLIDCLLPPAGQQGEVCWLNVPGPAAEESNEQRFFSQIIRLKGYTPRIIQPGLAVVLAELGQSGFSGLGCDFGSGYTRTSFAYHGRELFSTCVEQGGNWIDTRIAEDEGCILWDSEGNRYLNTNAIARWREDNLISVFKPISDREQRLSLLCEQVITGMLASVESELVKARAIETIREPLPVVCGGGLCAVPGFCELMFDMIRDSPLSFDVSEVRRCKEPDYTIARGSLILAELDQTKATHRVA